MLKIIFISPNHFTSDISNETEADSSYRVRVLVKQVFNSSVLHCTNLLPSSGSLGELLETDVIGEVFVNRENMRLNPIGLGVMTAERL